METIGFLELNSIAKGIETADIVLKTAAVDLFSPKLGCPGKYYLMFTGEVAAVRRLSTPDVPGARDMLWTGA